MRKEEEFITCDCPEPKPKLYDRHLGDGGYDWCSVCNGVSI